jgi:hypothetical protein
MFIVVLVTIAKLCKQLRCPSTDEWISKNVVYIHNGTSFSHTEERNYVICKTIGKTEDYHVK